MKVNLNINDELLLKVDEFAKQNYLTRTSFVNMVINQFFENRKSVQVLANLEPFLNKIAASGELSEDDFKQIESIIK